MTSAPSRGLSSAGFNYHHQTDNALKVAKTRQHIAVTRVGSHYEVGVSSQGGRCDIPLFCAHIGERQGVATRHAEIQAVWALVQRWGPAKFARMQSRLRIWSFAFVYNPETPTIPRLVGARPCRSCARALHHLGVRHVSHSTDAGVIETVAVSTLLHVAPLSLGERQLVWQADCERMATAEARGPLCTLWVNRFETFRFLQTGAKTEEWRCVFPRGANRSPSKKRHQTKRVPPVDPTETHQYKLRTPLYMKQRKADRDQQRRAKVARAPAMTRTPPATKRFEVQRVHAGEVLWVAYKAERVAMLVEHVRVDKQTTVRRLMARRGCWSCVVPDAHDLDEAARRFTEGCYAKKGRPHRHVCARVYQFRLRPLQLSLRADLAP